MTPEVGALADVREWSTAVDSGVATDAAERVLRWVERGGVPAGHWTSADHELLRLLMTASDAGRRLDQ